MYGDTWQVRWKEFLSDSYVYGSKIEFNEDGSVSYKNRLMPPGTVIHTWYSMTNFQGNRIEPSLPLIDGERAYSIAVNIDYHNSESEALMLRIIFFDRYTFLTTSPTSWTLACQSLTGKAPPLLAIT